MFEIPSAFSYVPLLLVCLMFLHSCLCTYLHMRMQMNTSKSSKSVQTHIKEVEVHLMWGFSMHRGQRGKGRLEPQGSGWRRPPRLTCPSPLWGTLSLRWWTAKAPTYHIGTLNSPACFRTPWEATPKLWWYGWKLQWYQFKHHSDPYQNVPVVTQSTCCLRWCFHLCVRSFFYPFIYLFVLSFTPSFIVFPHPFTLSLSYSVCKHWASRLQLRWNHQHPALR